MGNACNCFRGPIDGQDLNLLPPKNAAPLKTNLVALNFELPSDYTEKLKAMDVLKKPTDLTEDPKWYQIDQEKFYQGVWENDGKPSGFGKIFYKDKGLYEGSLTDCEPNGNGRFISGDGSIYNGEFKGVGNIKGSMLDVEGTEVFGEFKNLCIEGEGREIWKDGTTFSGMYCKGVKSGKGKLIWLNEKGQPNEIYEGNFEDNMFNGEGSYNWSNKRKYNGQWKAGKMHGHGVFEWKDGRIYIGEFIEDLKEGFGEFKWNDGRRWIGDWSNGSKSGIGLSIDNGGQEMVGEWVDDKRVRWLEGDEAKEAKTKIKSRMKNLA